MTDSYPIPALVWQSDIEALAALIDSRHAKLVADFNQYIVSEAAMALCVRIQRHVHICWMRDSNGLLILRKEIKR
jgi:hypothetical protein